MTEDDIMRSKGEENRVNRLINKKRERISVQVMKRTGTKMKTKKN